ncbi:MAG: NUDIX hydrolase [Nanoarchaeota archaeon]|nr:NUDIX hydrolase [Nanoarchaeota archaeon]MBU1004603.1 NUDIX hydrolase [Nanoarchaeota archaeon]MBU1945533.1 NUDIX hydrolase [Nanoarchaeota archaeon]
MKTYFVVTGVVKHNNKFLILKKAPDDYNYPNKWSFCSGFVKEFEAGEETIIREIKEETGLDGKIVKSGGIVEALDDINQKKWVIAVYLCEVQSPDVKLCHENTDFKWVSLEEMDNYPFVPGLSKDLKTLGLK